MTPAEASGWEHTLAGFSVTSHRLGRRRLAGGFTTRCARLLENGSVRLCCVGRLRHLRRKVQGVGGLNSSKRAAALASTSNCCRRTKKSGGDWDECLRVNPAHLVNPFLEKTLRREFEEALKSERSAIPFRQYRLNLPGGESTGEQELISDSEWARIVSRPVPDRVGRPIISLDLGGQREAGQRARVFGLESNRYRMLGVGSGLDFARRARASRSNAA